MVRRRCTVPGCENPGRHSVPKNPNRQTIWMKAMRPEGLELKKKIMFVCPLHFKDSDFFADYELDPTCRKRNHLKKDAVPSIFPWNQDNSAKDPEFVALQDSTSKSEIGSEKENLDLMDPLVDDPANLSPQQKTKQTTENLSSSQSIAANLAKHNAIYDIFCELRTEEQSTSTSLAQPSQSQTIDYAKKRKLETETDELAKRINLKQQPLPEESQIEETHFDDFHDDEPLPEPPVEAEEKPDVYLCHGCLSIDRCCRPATQADLAVLTKLLDRTFGPDDEFMACWECRAGLRRARLLRQRALHAAKLLAACETQSPEITPLSNLISSKREFIDIIPDPTIPVISTQDIKANANINLAKLDINQANLDINDDNVDIHEEIVDESEANFDENAPIDETLIDNELKELLKYEKTLEVEHVEHEQSATVITDNKHSKLGKVVSNDLTCKTILVPPERYREHMTVLPAAPADVQRCLNNETRLLERGKPHRCHACCVAYRNSTGLQNHQKKEHAQEDATHQCSMCKDHFSKVELSAHMREHVFVYKCDVCKRNCASEKRLRLHFETQHAQIYECNYCQLLFGSPSALTRHFLSLHYTFECAHCGVQYMARDPLERHMRVHNQ